MPTLHTNPLSPISPLCCFSDNISSGIQGARHAQFILSSSHPHFNNLQPGRLNPFDFKPLDYAGPLSKILTDKDSISFDALSHSLKKESSTENLKKSNDAKAPVFILFGQPILTEQQISQSCSVDTDENQENVGNVSNGSDSAVIQNCPAEASSDEEFPRFKDRKLEFGFETAHCKVFVESEDVGRTLDLSIIGSYEELYGKLATMFGMERLEMSSNVVYSDASGTTRHIGGEPFGDFVIKARRLTIPMDTGSDNRRN